MFLEKEEEIKLEVPKEEDECAEDKSLFSNLDSNNETYSTYSVYIMRDNDSIDSVMEKYKVTRLQLDEYNNLDDIKNGTKIIIPSSNE